MSDCYTCRHVAVKPYVEPCASCGSFTLWEAPQPSGASPVGDRAVAPAGSSPAVSSLRASIPSALLPCPFCGHESAAVVTSAEEMARDEDEDEDDDTAFYPHTPSWAVICDASRPNGPGGCGAMGGFMPSEAEAIGRWNARARDQAEGQDAQRLGAQPAEPGGEATRPEGTA